MITVKAERPKILNLFSKQERACKEAAGFPSPFFFHFLHPNKLAGYLKGPADTVYVFVYSTEPQNILSLKGPQGSGLHSI